jgi:flagellar motility protein MotE (MotC chaperone)
MMRRTDRIEEKLDALIGTVGEIKTDLAVVAERQKTLEEKIESNIKEVSRVKSDVDSLKQFRAKIVAYASIAGTAASIIGNKLGGWLWENIFRNKQ